MADSKQEPLLTFKKWRSKYRTILSDTKYLPEVTGLDDWHVLADADFHRVKDIIKVAEMRAVYGAVDPSFRHHRHIQLSVREDATDYVSVLLVSPKVYEGMRDPSASTPLPNAPSSRLLN